MPVTAQIPQDLVVDFDLLDPALAKSVDTFQERTAQLGRKGPVLYSPAWGGYWIVTRYDDVCTVLRDPETFSSWPNDLVNSSQSKFIPIELDPPDHTIYRKVLLPLFSPKRMHAIEPEIRSIINDLIDQVCEKGRCEFVEAFAHALPTRVFLSLMGWPLEDAALFSETVDVATQGLPDGSREESQQARADAASRIYGYFSDVIGRVNSGNYDMESLTAEIITTPVEFSGAGHRKLDTAELCQMFFLLLIAGLHTTQGSLAWSIINLAKHPEKRADLITHPDRIPNAVEEILRFEAAVTLGRRATRDAEVAGVKIAAGDRLITLLCSANRDESQFDYPGELLFDRAPNHHVSFGMGIHRCIGSHLARLELRLALEEIHRRIPDYRLVEGDLPRMIPAQVRSCGYLPIQFTPTPRSTVAGC